MTNIIPFKFNLYNDVNLKHIFYSIFQSKYLPFLDKYILNHILSFLFINYENMMIKTIKVVVRNYNYNDFKYDHKIVSLYYYDFIFQLSRMIWSIYLKNDEKFIQPKLFPKNIINYNNLEKVTSEDIINYPIQFHSIIKHKIFWLKLCIELSNDFYYINYYEGSYGVYFENKYYKWFNNLQY